MNWVSKSLPSDTSWELGTLIRKRAHVLTLPSNGPGTLNKSLHFSKSVCLNKSGVPSSKDNRTFI